MLMPASAEFVALCRSQVALLTQALGANLSIVYLTEEWNQGEDANLVPVVAHPEAAADWNRDQIVALLSGRSLPNQPMGQLPSAASGAQEESRQPGLPDVQRSPSVNPSAPLSEALAHPAQYPQQLVLPLVHEGVVMGLLVTARSDRPWRSQEQTQVERIARTLAIACMLDQKAQWADHELEQQALLRSQQHDLMDDLIHQFRNPLTALRTFGKLLVKRLLPEDPNHNVAEGIVRESDRLQDLLLQLDSAVDGGPTGLLPPAHDSSSTTDSSAAPDSPRLLPGTSIVANLTLGPHEVNEVLEPLLDTEMAIAQDRQIQIQVEIPPHLPTVHIDLKALQEVLNNLIDNALKYTPSGGQVLVVAGLERMVATTAFQGIAIIDNGPGIPAEDLPRLFQRHYRGAQAQSDIPGTGLGLAIARDLVQQMCGEIQVFSPARTSGLVTPEWERGTAIIVWLPESSED
jgi:signal transduction histidine kinase